VEPPGHLEFLADPDRVDIAASVMDWFEETTAPEDRACIVMSGDINTATELQRRGYSPASTGPYFLRLIRDLADLPAPITPPDYTIRHVRPGQAAQRAAVHRAGWSDFNSDLPAEDYAHLMQTYPYRPELDLVVAAPDDTWVASALGWYDPVNRVGLVEPVSCVPAHRRRGLATALNIALLHAFTDHGATTAVILPRGDDAYPAPRVLYEAIGYQPHGARTVLYT
jgi:predicted N-acetyltransferase YhbS